jgi:hypothetical protein
MEIKMYLIPLQQTPCQELSVTIEGIFYQIKLRYWSPDGQNGVIFSQVKVGDNPWSGSTRCVPFQGLIPYKYQTNGGNFYFVCTDYDYPDYKKFGIEHRLIFLNDTELKEIENV